MTIEEIKAALKQIRNEISLIEMDNGAAELDAAWNNVHDAVIELTKFEKREQEEKNVVLVNCCNYFHVTGQNRLTEALDAGKTVSIHIDCIGHQRTAYETRLYAKWLHEYYGERLECIPNGGVAGADAYRLKTDE